MHDPAMVDKLGRRISIMLGTIVFIVGGTLQIVGEKLAMLYTGRLIAGLGRYHSRSLHINTFSCFAIYPHIYLCMDS